MKRLSIILGRIGTVFLAICLALTILVFIPPSSSRMISSETRILKPKTFTFIEPSLSLSPQLILKVEINTNTTLTFYIFNLLLEDYVERIWIGNLTQFWEFMEENADKILLERTINSGSATVEFTPGGIVNASLILLNNSTHLAILSYKIELLVSVAPSARIIPIITYLSPIGAILTGQWIFVKVKDRRKI